MFIPRLFKTWTGLCCNWGIINTSLREFRL